MSYPTTSPTRKHDLLGFTELKSYGDDDPRSIKLYENAAEIFDDLNNSTSRQVVQWSSIYSYSDSPKIPCQVVKWSSIYSYSDIPKIPGPLSRNLIIIGFAHNSLSLVETVMKNKDGLYDRCTLGVKRADPSYATNLDQKNLENSHQFANLMQLLRKKNLVAVTGIDKYGRFCIMHPMRQRCVLTDYSAEDFAAVCVVATKYVVKRSLAQCGSLNQSIPKGKTKSMEVQVDAVPKPGSSKRKPEQNCKNGDKSSGVDCAATRSLGGDATGIRGNGVDSVLTTAPPQIKRRTENLFQDNGNTKKHKTSQTDPR